MPLPLGGAGLNGQRSMVSDQRPAAGGHRNYRNGSALSFAPQGTNPSAVRWARYTLRSLVDEALNELARRGGTEDGGWRTEGRPIPIALALAPSARGPCGRVENGRDDQWPVLQMDGLINDAPAAPRGTGSPPVSEIPTGRCLCQSVTVTDNPPGYGEAGRDSARGRSLRLRFWYLRSQQ